MAKELFDVDVAKAREILAGYGSDTVVVLITVQKNQVIFAPDDSTAESVQFENREVVSRLVQFASLRVPAPNLLAALPATS